MMAARTALPFTQVIVCLVLIRGYSPLPTNPMRSLKPRGFETEDLLPSSEDYTNLEDTVTPISSKTVPPVEQTFKRCDYDPCRESQISCSDLASTGCSCPGITPYNVAPETPSLRSVSWNGSEVVVRWCAPHSYVTAYAVTIGGEEKKKFGKDQRSGGVGDIDLISNVCVVAENDAGQSAGACMMYQPRDNSLPLKAGLIGGALGLLLLVLLAVLLWRRRRQRKQQASISMHDTAAGAQ